MTRFRLLFAASLLAVATGCSSETDAPVGSSDSNVEGEGEGECISQLPIEVWSIAAHLDLGRPVTSEGAAGSMYYEFESGSIVRWSNVESKISEVQLKASEGPTAGELSYPPLEVAAAADSNALGALVSEEGAAGSLYFTFARGLVRWSNVESKIIEVTRSDGSTAEASPPLAGKFEAGENVCLDVLPKPVWNIAANLDLGPVINEEGAAGSLYLSFANGSIIRWSNVENEVSEVTLFVKEGPTAGELESIPVDVVMAAADRGFGELRVSEGAAGSMYYSFQRGLIQWSNVDSKISSVETQ